MKNERNFTDISCIIASDISIFLLLEFRFNFFFTQHVKLKEVKLAGGKEMRHVRWKIISTDVLLNSIK